MKAGDIIKSFDFDTTDACYMIGVVTSVDNDRKVVEAKTIKRVWESRDKMFADESYFAAPLPGFNWNDDDPRVSWDSGQRVVSDEPRIRVVITKEEAEVLANADV